MSIGITPMSEVGGAEITGINVLSPITKENLRAINQAFLKFGVLLFRKQPMTAQQLATFSGQFGTLIPHVQKRYRHPDVPEVVYMTNRKPDGSFDEAGARRGAIETLRNGWHSDLSYDPEPAKATVLHSLEVPSSGGNTCFSNVTRAFLRMPEELKARVIGKRVEFPYGGHKRNKSAAMAASQLDSNATAKTFATHPVIVVNPETRRPAIYAQPLLASRILKTSEEESEKLLEALFDLIDLPEFHWEHNWSVGDTIIWENRGGIMHCGRLDYPRTEARRFIRATVRGGPTVAYTLDD